MHVCPNILTCSVANLRMKLLWAGVLKLFATSCRRRIIRHWPLCTGQSILCVEGFAFMPMATTKSNKIRIYSRTRSIPGIPCCNKRSLCKLHISRAPECQREARCHSSPSRPQNDDKQSLHTRQWQAQPLQLWFLHPATLIVASWRYSQPWSTWCNPMYNCKA